MEITQGLAEEIHQILGRVQTLDREGQTAEAKNLCLKTLKLCPEHPDTNQILGLMLFQEKDFKAAKKHLTQSLKSVPEQPFVCARLGQTLTELKHAGQAKEAFRKAIALAPEFAAAYGYLAEITDKSETPALIDAIFEVFLTTSELHPETRIQFGYILALCFRKISQADKAADCEHYYKYFQAIVKTGVSAPAHPPEEVKKALNRARDSINAGNFRRAEKLAASILENDPDQADALQIQGRVKGLLNDSDGAIEIFRKVLRIAPGQPALWVKIGNSYTQVRKFEEADHAFKMAVLYDPRHAEAIYWLGHSVLGRGDNELARRYLERSISLDPGFSQAYELLQRVRGFEVDQVFLGALEENAASPASLKAVFANYTLATHHYRQKNRQKFLSHVKAANSLQRDLAPLTVDKDGPLVKATKDVFQRIDPGTAADDRNKLITPIFIVSLFRSGSTLVEQILARHAKVSAGDELHFIYSHLLTGIEKATRLPYPAEMEKIDTETWGQLGRMYQRRLAEIAPEAPCITDKLPHNVFYVGPIQQAMPWAKVIFIDRNPIDRALSIYSHYFSESFPYCFDQKHLARHTKLVAGMMDFWNRRYPGFVLDVQYEDLVADLEGQTRRILDFCGLDWDPACLEFYKSERTVLTLSIGQVHKPIYTSAIGKWKEYGDLLEPFRAEMGDLLDADGFWRA